LSHQFEGFLTGEDIQVEMVVRVINGDVEIALSEQPLFFENEAVIVKTAGLEGLIRCEKGFAEINLPETKWIENTEYFLRLVTALQVFYGGGLMFHAAGIVKDDCAYLFFGHSGAGKTTVARNSPGAIILNDDLVILTRENETWRAHATPFSNPTQVNPVNQSAILQSIYRLVQDDHVYLESMSTGQAFAEVLANVPVIPEHPGWRGDLLIRCQALIDTLPVYKLHFLPDGSFWKVIGKSQS
jgi:hypothetical protein